MDERRKFTRYSKDLYLKLFVYDTKIAPAIITNFKARTIDVSRGGFRMKATKNLRQVLLSVLNRMMIFHQI